MTRVLNQILEARSSGGSQMKLFMPSALLAGVLIAAVLVSSVGAQSGGDRPPGVPSEHWIAISDSVGIAVATVPPKPNLFRLDPNQPGVRIPVEPDASMKFGVVGSLRGVLMAKQDGFWNRIVIELPPAQTLPLEH
jgi:hypothetical protein